MFRIPDEVNEIVKFVLLVTIGKPPAHVYATIGDTASVPDCAISTIAAAVPALIPEQTTFPHWNSS